MLSGITEKRKNSGYVKKNLKTRIFGIIFICSFLKFDFSCLNSPMLCYKLFTQCFADVSLKASEISHYPRSAPCPHFALCSPIVAVMPKRKFRKEDERLEKITNTTYIHAPTKSFSSLSLIDTSSAPSSLHLFTQPL